MHNLMVSVTRGENILLEDVKEISNSIRHAVLVNKDAILYSSREKKPGQYTPMRSISFCALLTNFAYYMGYSRQELGEIALGGLLHDIGKMWVSQHLIHKTGKLSQAEFACLKDHVQYSELIMQGLRLNSQLIQDIVTNHHERIDGSGYPKGLKGKELSKISQMAMIVDVYDALTSERSYKLTLEPFQALHYLGFKCKNKFNKTLLQHFIKSIGLYPMGSIVKMPSQMVGIVVGQTDSLLNPTIKLFYDFKNKRYISPINIDATSSNNESTDKAPLISLSRAFFSSRRLQSLL